MSAGTGPAKRFPILLWGDLVENAPPVLRRALAGFRAHECMYAWVYLTEHLAHQRLLQAIPSMRPEDKRDLIRGLDADLWKQVDRKLIDPHYQLSAQAFEAVAYMACLAAQSGEKSPIFVELGSTFFTLRTKFEIVERLASERFADWPRLQPKWLGIDNSSFMHDTTRALHRQGDIELIDDYKALAKPGRYAIFLSRFVASYVFPSARGFADYLIEHFEAALLEDAYSTTGQDVPVFNHGQSEVFFSIPDVLARLEGAGFEVHLLGSYPDFPAGSAPCHVIRYLAVRKGGLTEKARAYLTALGLNPPRAPSSSSTLLKELNASVTDQQWRTVEKAKQESPVWGPTTGVARSSLLSRGKNALRQLIRPRWRRYRLGGPLAVREIKRAVEEENP